MLKNQNSSHFSSRKHPDGLVEIKPSFTEWEWNYAVAVGPRPRPSDRQLKTYNLTADSTVTTVGCWSGFHHIINKLHCI